MKATMKLEMKLKLKQKMPEKKPEFFNIKRDKSGRTQIYMSSVNLEKGKIETRPVKPSPSRIRRELETEHNIRMNFLANNVSKAALGIPDRRINDVSMKTAGLINTIEGRHKRELGAVDRLQKGSISLNEFGSIIKSIEKDELYNGSYDAQWQELIALTGRIRKEVADLGQREYSGNQSL